MLADTGRRTLVAERGGELSGYCTVGRSRDADAAAGVGEVYTLFVKPSSWRRGVGTTLMHRALDELHGWGFVEATVWSFADNQRANAFYERCGFRRDGAEQSGAVWAHLLEVRYRRALP